MNRSGTCEQDLQMTSATPHVNGTIAHGSALKHAILCISTYHDIPRLAIPYEPQHDKTNKVACAPSKDSDQPGHPLYAQLVAKDPRFSMWTSDWPDAQADLGKHVILFVLSCCSSYTMQCPPVPCDAFQAIVYTLPWTLGHTKYPTVPTRPYNTPFLARQAIPHSNQPRYLSR